MAQSFADSNWKQPIFASISTLNKYCRFCKYQVILLFATVRAGLDLLGPLNNIVFDVFKCNNCICRLCVADRLVMGELFYIKLDPVA